STSARRVSTGRVPNCVPPPIASRPGGGTRMPDGRPVQVVSDRSAVASFVKQSLAVGEMIAVLVDDDVDFGVPVTVLAEASLAASGADADMLNHLVRHL